VFEEVFIRTGQPYKVVGGVRFYERREVRDALAYLRMLVNPADEISLRRILNTPKRGIGDRAVACVTVLAERERVPFWEALRRSDEAPGLASRSHNAISGFVAMVEELQSMVAADERPDVVLESVLDRSGYLAELEGSDDPQDICVACTGWNIPDGDLCRFQQLYHFRHVHLLQVTPVDRSTGA
jgi:DNA helicase-2/ATP-dependent DNA helicase PcrA